ncbi:hypothetical protein CMV_007488 [Castanea mollissima]|uniref:Uncharacterized protein n=1 Tax=Castanea mollissima TaxID=60419 RepID=A0A8J4RN29_9ROSI|nr:hypothetical protein CMV_007488 [Castanea mollissima]
MDPHRAGPSIGTVLTRQPMHRSSLLWDAPLVGEEVPGVLTCCHRDKDIKSVVHSYIPHRCQKQKMSGANNEDIKEQELTDNTVKNQVDGDSSVKLEY